MAHSDQAMADGGLGSSFTAATGAGSVAGSRCRGESGHGFGLPPTQQGRTDRGDGLRVRGWWSPACAALRKGVA